MSLSCAAGSKLMPCDLLLRQYTVELSDCILTRIDLCRIDPRSVKDWPDVTGRSVTDWLEVWRIDQKLQTWHGKDRPEVIDQKCEGLTRSVKDWPGLTRSMCLKHVCTLYILHEMCLLFEMAHCCVSMCMVVQLSYSDLQCILCWQVSNSFQDLKAALVGFQHEDRSIGFGTRRWDRLLQHKKPVWRRTWWWKLLPRQPPKSVAESRILLHRQAPESVAKSVAESVASPTTIRVRNVCWQLKMFFDDFEGESRVRNECLRQLKMFFEGEEAQTEASSPSSQFTKKGVFKATVTKPASSSRFAHEVEGDDELRWSTE